MTDIPPTEAPVPPVGAPPTPNPWPPPGVYSIQTDYVEPAPLTPPGTVVTGFWGRSGTVLALVATVAFVNGFFVRPWITSRFGEAAAVAFDGLEWAWLAAFGIQRVGPPSLRYS